MATFVTNGSAHASLMGSPEKRLDTAPDGTLWLLVSEPSHAKMFSSKDGGSTWQYAKDSDLKWNEGSGSSQTATFPSFYIDAEGFAHVSWALWNRDPQQMRYARGRPVTGGGWSWTSVGWSPAAKVAVDSDVVAFRNGSGWVAWVTAGKVRTAVSRINVSSAGVLTVASVNTGPPDPPDAEPWYGTESLEFAHLGDGKTPATAPHLFLVAGGQDKIMPLYVWRATFATGAWTWDAPVVLDASARLWETVMVSTYDGERVCTVYENLTGDALLFTEWVPGTAVVRRNLPALPAGMNTSDLLGCSMAHDPATDNLYVVAYTAGTGTGGDASVFGTRLVRSTGVWDAWAKVAQRTGHGENTTRDGKVQLVRHAPKDAVDMVSAAVTSATSSTWRISHERLATLVRTPSEPALGEPANGARADLAAGATFTWTYRGTSQADAQQGWSFRRVRGTVTEFWNAGSQAWQATEVVNSGTEGRATFPPGAWPNGATYLWSVRTRSGTNQDGPYAANRTVVATAAPVVDVTGPAGLLFTESTPTVTWTYASADAQRTYEVRVFVEAAGLDPETSTPVWTSGVVSSAAGRSVRIDTPLSDGTTYRAYVRATSTAGLTSLWSDSLFTLTLTAPTGPSVRVAQAWSFPGEVPYARLRLVGRTNHLGEQQARGLAGWEAGANTTVGMQGGNLVNLVEEGLTLTAVAAGDVEARTVLGAPPEAPLGQPQPLGPLAFPVRAGEDYTALAHFRAADTLTRAARVVLRWYTSDEGADANDPAQASSVTVGDQANVGSTQYGIASVTVTAPANAKRVTVAVQVLGMALGEVAYVSRISLHPGGDRRWQPGGFVTSQTIRVERSTDDGATWQPVADRVGVDAYQRAVVADRLMPLGTQVRYRAFTDVGYSTGARLSSGSSPLATQRIDSVCWVLRDPLDRLGEVNALVVNHSRGDKDAATVSRPVGREFAVVDTEGALSAEGTLTIYVPGISREQTVELLRRGRPLLVQSPIGAQFLAHFLSRDYEPEMAGARTIPAQYVEVG